MSVKKKLMMSAVLAVLGISMITGGTSAYFTDSTSANNMIATGSLDLGINKETIFQMEDLMPGDTQEAQFTLTNEGSVDMKEVTLNTSYEVADNGIPYNGGVDIKKILSEISNNPQHISKKITAGSTGENFMIQIKFVDNGENENHFQKDQLKLNWEFKAVQLGGNTEVQ